MKNKQGIPRREFLQTISLASFTLIPGIDVLAGVTDKKLNNVGDPCDIKAFRLIDYRNLLTLEFYFINNIKEDSKGGNKVLVQKEDNGYQESYMIVRLPQQHIAEQFLDIGKNKLPSFFAISYISGYSYLVFRILWDKKDNKQIEITQDALLNWNAIHFKLVIKQNLKQSIFQIEKDKPSSTYIKPGENHKNAENHYPLGYRKEANTNKLKFDKSNFPTAYSKYDNNRCIDPAPITAIEAPYKLILSPQLPDQGNYEFKWSFTNPKNDDPKQGCELWMATLKAERKEKQVSENHNNTSESKDITNNQRINPTPKSDLPAEFQNDGSNNLQLMIIGSPDYKPELYNGNKIADCDPSCDKNEILPNSYDRSDIVNLYTDYKIKATTPKISFTPLGLSANIELKNKIYQQTLTRNNNLYEWKQSISFGRDQEAEISRVVVEYPFGLKMLHIKKTKRQTYKGGSILIYREFLMPLEIEKDFTLYNNNDNIDNYTNPNWKCASPFKKVQFADLSSKQIMSMEIMIENASKEKDAENLIELLSSTGGNCFENVLSFWPRTKDGYPLKWPFKITDWHDNEFVQEKEIHVFTSTLGYSCNDTIAFKKEPITDVEQNLFQEFKSEKGKNEVFSKTFQQLSLDINTNIDKQVGTGNTIDRWLSILKKAEHFDLKKIDYYTDYLEVILENTETKIRTAADKIEDQVIGEWAIFKRKILEKENKLLRSTDKVIDYLREEILKDEASFDMIVKAVEAARERIISEINLSSASMLDKIKIEIKKIQDKIENSINILKEKQIKIALQKFEKVKKEFEDIYINIQLGFEQEYKEFLEQLPQKFRNKITGTIQEDVDKIRRCVNEIRKLEDNIKNKVEFKKAKFGYAVYKVEDELQDLKKKVQKEFPAQWEEKYSQIRDIYQKEINGKLSEFETEFITLKGNLKTIAKEGEQKLFDFFDEYSCFPQLHTAAVTIKAVNDLVNKEIPCKIRYAEDYVRNQVHDTILNIQDNASRAFAEIKADAKEYVKSAVKEINKELGGFVNPDLAAEYITYLKDKRTQVNQTVEDVLKDVNDVTDDIKNRIKDQTELIKNEFEDRFKQENEKLQEIYNVTKEEFNGAIADGKKTVQLIGKEAKEHFEEYRDWAKIKGDEFFKGLEAKILGAIHLKDIFGEGFELPKLNRADNKIYYKFITNRLKPIKLGPFSFINQSRNAQSSLVVYLEKPLNNPSNYVAWTRLSDFTIGIFENRIIVEFEKLQIYSDAKTKNKVSVDIGDVKFTQELAFLEALSKNIKIPGTGLSVNIYPKEINIDFAYSMPGISGGAFTFDNLKFGVGVIIPLPIGAEASQSPVTAKFSVNAPDDKFVVAAGIWGGKGHFVLETTPKYIKRIDIGIDFGGYLALNLGIAKGEAFLMAGIRYVYFRDELGETGFEFYATLSCGGSVTVFGFITISVVFLLCLKYEKYQGASTLYGTASVTYSIKIGFFRKSFSLTFSRRLHGSANGEQQNDIGYNTLNNPNRPLMQNAVYITTAEDNTNNYSKYIRQDDFEQKLVKAKPLRECYSSKQWQSKIKAYKF